MKTIAFLTIAATLLSCATNNSSVGGPLTDLLILVLAVWAIGVQQAWSKGVGLLGWIASIVLSMIGGATGIAIASEAMHVILSVINFEGSLAKSNHPLYYILSAAMAIITVLGAWGPIQILNLLTRLNSQARGDA